VLCKQKNTFEKNGNFENHILKVVLKRFISGHGRQPSMVFIFSTCKKKLSSQFFDLDIENALGRGTLAK
jgi:hypothetical protein